MRAIVLALTATLAIATAPVLGAEHAGPDKKSDTKKDAKKQKDKANENAHVTAASPTYLGFDPLYTTIIEDDGDRGLLMVGFGLDVPDAHLRAEVENLRPKLLDLYVRSMMLYTSANVRTWRQPDAAAIADRLQQVTNLLLKRKGAKVLLAQVAIRLNR
jgi:flagellar basal body-associated protein FliL